MKNGRFLPTDIFLFTEDPYLQTLETRILLEIDTGWLGKSTSSILLIFAINILKNIFKIPYDSFFGKQGTVQILED